MLGSEINLVLLRDGTLRPSGPGVQRAGFLGVPENE